MSNITKTSARPTLRGLYAVLVNAQAAVDRETGRLAPGYAPRLHRAIDACSILEMDAEKALASGREITDDEVNGVSDAVNALDAAYGAASFAGDHGTARKVLTASHRLLSGTQRPLWIAQKGQ